MYNFPIIPIIVFVVLVVTPLVIGFLRGWKASLFIALITLAFVGIEVGIAFAIYDSLWDWFKSLFVKDLQPGLSPESMKDTSKASVIILFIGICMLPTYGLVMALYFPMRKLMLKHLFPKTNDINSNQKEISRSPHLASRITGVGIAGVSSLFFASSASAAAATIFTKKENRSGFNDFTSRIANLYTFGQGKFDNDFFVARDFAKNELTTKHQNAIADVLLLDKDRDASVDASYNALSSGHFHDELNKIMNKPDVMRAITEMVLESSSNKNTKIKLNDIDYQPKDAHGNNNGSKTVAFNKMDARLATYANHTPLNIHAGDETINKILEYLRSNAFTPFEKTGYYLQWKNSDNLISALNQNVDTQQTKQARLNTEFITLKNHLQDYYNKQSQMENRLNQIGSDGKTNSYSTIQWLGPIDGVNKTITNSNGLERQSYSEIQRLTSEVATKQNNFDTESTKFTGSPTGAVNHGGISKTDQDKLRLKQTAEFDKNNKQIELDQTNQDIAGLNRNLTSDKRDLVNNQRLIHDLPAQISTARANEVNVQKQIDSEGMKNAQLRQSSVNEYTEAQRLKTVFEGKNQNIQNIEQAITQIKSNIANINSTIKSAQSDVDALKRQNSKDQSAINAAQSKLTTAQKDLKAKSDELAAKQGELTTAKADAQTAEHNWHAKETSWKRVSDELKASNDKITQLNTQKSSFGYEAIRLNNKFTTAKADAITNQTHIQRWNTELSTKQSEKTKLEGELSTLTAEYNKRNSDYNTYHQGTFTTQKNRYDNAQKQLQTTKSQLTTETNKHNDLLSEKNQIIQDLKNQIQSRKNQLKQMQNKADEINEFNWRTTQKLINEDFAQGNDKVMPVYNSKHAQSSTYYNWAFGTLAGAKDYLEKGKQDSQLFEKIKNDAQVERERLINKYLETIRGILKS